MGRQADVGLIVHDENRLGLALWHRRLAFVFPGGALRRAHGQVHLKGGALAGVTVDGDKAPVTLDDAQHRGKAQPGPLAYFLRGEEGIENAFDNRRGNALAGVAHLHPHVRSGVGLRLTRSLGGRKHDILDLDHQLAAFGHGVPRIDAEIHEDLVQLGRVADHRPKVANHIVRDGDVAREGLAHDAGHLLHQMAQLHEHPLARHAATEHQELADDAGAPLRTGLDHRQQIQVVTVRHSMLQQARHHQNGRQDIVEVVRHPAGQRSDRLHALGPEKTAPPVFCDP